MRSLLLLSAVFVAVAAQVPPHLLFTPQNYYIGTEATFSLTSYSPDPFRVTLRLSYRTCTCNPSTRCGGGVIYARDTELVEPAFNGQPTLLKVKMPSLAEINSRRYYVSITSHGGDTVFLSRRQIYFSRNHFGFLLVKTDKPIYKPSQTLNLCVLHLDSTLRPHNANSTVEVVIRDSRFRQILKTSITIKNGEGVECMEMQLSDQPNLGRWSVRAEMKINLGPGECTFHYSRPSSTCGFSVDEFVLPKFEVSVDGPKQITRDDEFIEGTVEAKYTFGENVQGDVRVNATLQAAGRRETFLFSDVTARLKNGEYAFRIDTEQYTNKVRYRYDPFCVRSTVQITAEVTESGRGDRQADSIIVPLVANPISVKFDESNPTVFRPGLPYTVKGLATRADGSPAVRVNVKLTATANNGRRTLLDRTLTTDRSGAVSISLDVDANVRCLKFTLSPSELERSCDSQSACFSPSPMFSPTNSHLQLTHTSPSDTLKPGKIATVLAEATFPFSALHLVVVGQGNVQLHTANFTTNGRPARSLRASFPVDAAGVPRVKVLAVVAREDGELVADLIEIPVSCQLRHEVGLSFDRKEASPGDEVSITTTASPGSVVVLGVIDKSLSLLADACKSVDTSNVCRLLRGLTGGSRPSSASCSTASGETSCCPSSCSEPTKRGVADMFRAAGITLTTNMFQPSPPAPPVPPTPPPFFFDRPGLEAAPILPTTVPPRFEAAPTSPAPPPPGVDEETTDFRDFFPETWLWHITKANKSGVALVESEVPDTITTWHAEAFAIHRDSGLGISPLVELTVKKDLFVSLELPYSIIFKETVTVTPVVFYFGPEKSVVVRVYVTVDNKLELVENELYSSRLVRIARGTGTPFNITLKPRAIGRLPITICVRAPSRFGAEYESRQPCVDAVRKNLFVKPGCERFQITNNVYAAGAGRQCFNYSLPSCVIPDSSKARITVTGDLLSPPDLDRLLVLPYGCGEQNMVRFSLNVVVSRYLMHTGQLLDHLAVKIRNNLQTGYQRQLTYLQSAGCFSIWRHSQCSLWLTAFTTRYLVEASDTDLAPALGFSEGSELVDSAVISSAVNYLVRRQEGSGKFPVIGRLHNYYLMSRDDFIGLTAYVAITLRTVLATGSRDSRVIESVRRAERYISTQYSNSSIQFCNYGLALSTTALSVGNTPTGLPVLAGMVGDLKNRIQDSRNYPGACFLCNDCPNDEDSNSPNTAECSSRPRGEGSSSCVETTAYALRALLQVEDTEKTVCLAQWLTEVKSASGGFYSSQDTLVALDALGRFAEETFTRDLNKGVVVSVSGQPSVSHTITADNRYDMRTFEVPDVPSTNNCVLYTGVGTAIIQSTLEYYGCSCCDNSQTFSLVLSTRKARKSLDLTVHVGYQGTGESNMAIVDVEIASGYVYTEHQDPRKVIQRYERRGSNVIFYFTEIDEMVQFVVNFVETNEVKDNQQVPVTVYDYYEPDQIVTKYYLPVTNEATPSLSPPTRPPTRPTQSTQSTRPTRPVPPTGEGEGGE